MKQSQSRNKDVIGHTGITDIANIANQADFCRYGFNKLRERENCICETFADELLDRLVTETKYIGFMDENDVNNVKSADFEAEDAAGETNTSRSGFGRFAPASSLSSAVLVFLLNDISTELQSTERKLSDSRREVSTLEIKNRDISDQLDRATA